MGVEILETKWGEVLAQLESEGLPKEKAKQIFPGAVAFLVEVENKKKEAYLTAEVLGVEKDTIARLQQIQEKYPQTQGFIDFLFREERAQLLLERTKKEVEEKGEPRTIRILYLCDEGLKLDVFTEWTYLGKEKRMWRRTDKEGGEVGINYKTIEAGVHLLDFRPENREEWKPRHFMPTDWHGRNQVALGRYLGELAKKADEAYKAARAAKKAEKPTGEIVATGPTATETLPQLDPGEVPLAAKSTRKSRNTRRGESEDKTKAPNVLKIRGGRAGAKAEVQQEIAEGLQN